MKMTEYHTFYTLPYIAEKRLRIKPKDEEEAKQVIKYLYAMGYQWSSGTIQDTFYSNYGDKTSYRIYPNKNIAFSGEMSRWIAPQQIVGKEETDNIGSNCTFYKFIEKQIKEQVKTKSLGASMNKIWILTQDRESVVGCDYITTEHYDTTNKEWAVVYKDVNKVIILGVYPKEEAKDIVSRIYQSIVDKVNIFTMPE